MKGKGKSGKQIKRSERGRGDAVDWSFEDILDDMSILKSGLKEEIRI